MRSAISFRFASRQASSASRFLIGSTLLPVILTPKVVETEAGFSLSDDFPAPEANGPAVERTEVCFPDANSRVGITLPPATDPAPLPPPTLESVGTPPFVGGQPPGPLFTVTPADLSCPSGSVCASACPIVGLGWWCCGLCVTLVSDPSVRLSGFRPMDLLSPALGVCPAPWRSRSWSDR